jgi:acylphosphatase
MERVRIVVQGRVQGVGFRSFVWMRARQLGLAGEVRNRPDGRVEVVAEGERTHLDELLRVLWTGPPAARVSDVTAAWDEGRARYEGFHIT